MHLDKNIEYMRQSVERYCLGVATCNSCRAGYVLNAATGRHHRCGNGHGWHTSGDMTEQEITIAYRAFTKGDTE